MGVFEKFYEDGGVMLLKAEEAAKTLNIGRSTVYELIHTDPTFPAVWIHDHCVRIVEAQLPAWLEGRLAQKEGVHNPKEVR